MVFNSVFVKWDSGRMLRKAPHIADIRIHSSFYSGTLRIIATAFLKIKRHKNRYVIRKLFNKVFERHGFISVADGA